MNKTISIIIPNYNKAKYIRQCLESVLSQTYEYLDVIVVDDCSTDNSLQIINDVARQSAKITVIALEKNGGVSHARNVGVENSHAEYVTFLDSDDVYVNRRKIENELKIAEPYSVAFSQYICLNEDGSEIPYSIVKKNEYSSKNAISDILAISKPGRKQLRGYVVSRQLFDKVGGYAFPKNLYEDFDFQCRLALNARFVYTHEIGEGYRLHTGGLSHTTAQEAKQTVRIIQNKYYRELTVIQKIKYRWNVMFRFRLWIHDRFIRGIEILKEKLGRV